MMVTNYEKHIYNAFLTTYRSKQNLPYKTRKNFAKFEEIKHSFVAVAVAYDDQKVEKIVHDKYDKTIDYVMTEKSVYQVK